MSTRDDIVEQALALPVEDRAFVIAALADSIGDVVLPPDATGADSDEAQSGDEFVRELQRRSEAYRTGKTTARLAADVIADMRRREASA